MTISTALLAFFLFGFLTVIFVSLYFEKKAHISPTPTMPWVRQKMMSVLASHLDHDAPYRIAELGCGWGGMTKAMTTSYPYAAISGFELSFFPYWLSKLRALLYHGHVTVRQNDFFDEDLSGFNVVVCYLSPYHMEKLKPQLDTLKTGSIVISNAFPIPGWTAARVGTTKVGVEIGVFLYVVA